MQWRERRDVGICQCAHWLSCLSYIPYSYNAIQMTRKTRISFGCSKKPKDRAIRQPQYRFAQRLDARFLSPSTSINDKTHEVARLSRCQVVSDQMHLAEAQGGAGQSESRRRRRDEDAASGRDSCWGYKGKRKKARTWRRRGRNPVGQGHPPSRQPGGSNHRPYVTALESRS